MRETWCAARQAFVANPGANESSLPPAMADSLYPPRCANCQWMLVAIRESVGAGHQSFCETRAPSLCRAWGMDWCRHSSLRTRRPDLLSREFGCCNVVTVARAFELGAKWEASPAAERGVGQFIHRLRRDAA